MTSTPLTSIPWLTTRQTCAYLQMGLTSMHRMIRDGLIPYHVLKAGRNRTYRFNRSELDRWMMRNGSLQASEVETGQIVEVG